MRTRAAELAGPSPYAGAHAVLQLVISQLTMRHWDPNAFFIPPITAAGPGQTFSPPPIGDELPNGAGYLALLPFIGPDYAAADEHSSAIYTLITEARDTACGWVIDLRGYGNGDITVPLGGLAPLLPPGTLLHVRDAAGNDYPLAMDADGAFRFGGPLPWMAELTAPSDPELRELPVAVLVDGQTEGTGEALAILLAGRDRTMLFGVETSGAAFDSAGMTLLDGAFLAITGAWIASPNGAISPEGVTPMSKYARRPPRSRLKTIALSRRRWHGWTPSPAAQAAWPPRQGDTGGRSPSRGSTTYAGRDASRAATGNRSVKMRKRTCSSISRTSSALAR